MDTGRSQPRILYPQRGYLDPKDALVTNTEYTKKLYGTHDYQNLFPKDFDFSQGHSRPDDADDEKPTDVHVFSNEYTDKIYIVFRGFRTDPGTAAEWAKRNLPRIQRDFVGNPYTVQEIESKDVGDYVGDYVDVTYVLGRGEPKDGVILEEKFLQGHSTRSSVL